MVTTRSGRNVIPLNEADSSHDEEDTQEPPGNDGQEEGALASPVMPPPPPSSPPNVNNRDMLRPVFQFWKDMTPEERAQRASTKHRRPVASTPRISPRIHISTPQGSSILDKDWEEKYKTSLTFQ